MRNIDFIPETHRELPLLRLLLPWRRGNAEHRWRELLPEDGDLSPDANWSELATGRFGPRYPADISPPSGRLSRVLCQRLTEILSDIGQDTVRYRIWDGYSDAVEATGDGAAWALVEGAHPPLQLWDAEGTFALGCVPYPDSLIIAASPRIFRALHQAPDLEAVTVRATDPAVPSSLD